MPTNRPKCPYCGSLLAYWPARALATSCSACCRPLMLVPASFKLQAYRILSVLDAARVAMFPIVGGVIVAFLIGRTDAHHFANAVALALISWGAIDIFDGAAGLLTGLDKVRRRILHRSQARRSSILKVAFGGISFGLGATGILMLN